MSQQFANRSTGQIVSLVVGVGLILMSAPCVVAMIHDIVTQADNLVGAITAGTFFIILGIIGGFMTWWGAKKPAATAFRMDANVERRILHFARSHGGRVTVALLAAESPLSLSNCQAALESMELRGVCRSEFETSGALTYVFPDFVVDDPHDVAFDFERLETNRADRPAEESDAEAQAGGWQDKS